MFVYYVHSAIFYYTSLYKRKQKLSTSAISSIGSIKAVTESRYMTFVFMHDRYQMMCRRQESEEAKYGFTFNSVKYLLDRKKVFQPDLLGAPAVCKNTVLILTSNTNNHYYLASRCTWNIPSDLLSIVACASHSRKIIIKKRPLWEECSWCCY